VIVGALFDIGKRDLPFYVFISVSNYAYIIEKKEGKQKRKKK
jgi:hypothetical protein